MSVLPRYSNSQNWCVTFTLHPVFRPDFSGQSKVESRKDTNTIDQDGGVDDELRTRNTQLGRLVLYQLNYIHMSRGLPSG